jgi:hypothetical protein
MEQQKDWFYYLAIGYPVALFVVGLILMLWPRRKKKKDNG